MLTRRILVYHPEPTDTRAYAELIRLPSRGWAVTAALTPEAAIAGAPEAEVLYCWRPPRELLAAATRLRWIQCMGAGVEQLLVPEVSPRVTITRVAGIFGPWMAEYALGWCLWVTQRMDRFRADQRARRWAPVDPIPLRGPDPLRGGPGRHRRAHRAHRTRPGPARARRLAQRSRGPGGGARVPHARAPRRAPPRRLRRADPAAQRGHPRPARARRARGHEALGVADQRRAGPDRGRGGPARRAPGPPDRRRHPRRLRHRAAAPRAPAVGARQRGDHPAHLGAEAPRARSPRSSPTT